MTPTQAELQAVQDLNELIIIMKGYLPEEFIDSVSYYKMLHVLENKLVQFRQQRGGE